MTNYLQTPETRHQLAARAAKMVGDGLAYFELAEALAVFEDATGRAVLVSESRAEAEIPPSRKKFLDQVKVKAAKARQGDEPGKVASIKPKAEAKPHVEPNGISIENAAPPEQCPHTVTHHDMRAGIVTCDKCQAVLSRFTATPEPVAEAPAAPQAEPEARKAPPAAPTPPAKPQSQPAASTAPQRPIAKPDHRSEWDKLTMPERRIVLHLEGLPAWGKPGDDLQLVELLCSGSKITAAAQFLKVEADDALARWNALLCDDVLGANGRPSFDGQSRLLRALRYQKDKANA